MSAEKRDLTKLYDQLQLPEPGRNLVEQIRHSQPVRRVGSGRSNVCVRYASAKMGVVIQAESRTVEYPFVIHCEFNPDVLEYWDQPTTLKLSYERADGKHITHLHTPDFLVISKDSAVLKECKAEADLVRLSEKYPEKYQRDADGKWRNPVAEKAAADFGLGYEIVTPRQLSAVFTRNCEFLTDYFTQTRPPTDPDSIRGSIATFFKDSPMGTLHELIAHTKDADSVYWALVNRLFYLDLESSLVAKPQSARVFVDEVYASALWVLRDRPSKPVIEDHTVRLEPNAVLLWDQMSWRVVNVGVTEVVLKDEVDNLDTLTPAAIEKQVREGKLIGLAAEPVSDKHDRVLRASKRDLEIALARYHAIEPLLRGEPPKTSDISERTLYNWLGSYRDAERLYGIGLLGLIPDYGKRGNRTKRLVPEVQELLDHVIDNVFGSITCSSRKGAHNELVTLCDAKGLTPCSYETVCDQIRGRDPVKMTEKRHGRKAAYQIQGPMAEPELDLPPHGDRVFEVVHIDHTPIDLKIVSALTGEVLCSLWLTIAVDDYSKVVLSHFLTFEEPSYRSAMMVLRECVRRHHRFPQKIVVDQGPEFNSTYFEQLIASFGAGHSKFERPKSEPKFGKPVERTFGSSQSQFVHMLLGNTQNLKLGRSLSRSHRPEPQAVWTAEAFDELLTDWLYTVYPNVVSTGISEKPAVRFKRSLAESGMREHKLIPYDQAFILLTMPNPDRKPKANPQHGLRVNYMDYWAPELGHPDNKGKPIDVRYEPFDPSYIYAFLNKRWIRCTSRYQLLKDFTERDIQKAADEIRQLRKLSKQSYRVTPHEIRDFLLRVRTKEADLIESKKALHQRFKHTPENPGPGSASPVADTDAPVVESAVLAPLPVTQLRTNRR